jgi:hypothetical protein
MRTGGKAAREQTAGGLEDASGESEADYREASNVSGEYNDPRTEDP